MFDTNSMAHTELRGAALVAAVWCSGESFFAHCVARGMRVGSVPVGATPLFEAKRGL